MIFLTTFFELFIWFKFRHHHFPYDQPFFISHKEDLASTHNIQYPSWPRQVLKSNMGQTPRNLQFHVGELFKH